MKKIILSLVAFAIATTSIFAQADFEKEVSAWHKKAAMTCGMIKSPEAMAKSEMIAKNLASLETELGTMTKTYQTNPPAAYKNDPIFASYFVDLADNLTVVKYFASKQEFRVAAKSCSVFCNTILRMHKNNGTVDLADMLFSLNMQLKLATDISNTGNIKGAEHSIAMIKDILAHANGKLKSMNNNNMSLLFAPVETETLNWIKAIESADAASAKNAYTSFGPNFQKIFMASM